MGLAFWRRMTYIDAMPVLKRFSLQVSEKELMRLHRPAIGARLRERIKEAVEEAERLARPQAIYAIKRVCHIAGQDVGLEAGPVFHGENLVRSWENAELLGIALCTIGPAVESRVSQLSAQGNFLAATLLDSAASLAVESVADRLNFHLCQWAARRGLKAGPRLSPGYGQWDVAEQRLLFSLLPTAKIGVQLNEQCMMIPVKSISFCLGMGKAIEPASVGRCRHCTLVNCQYRRGAGVPEAV